MGMEVDARKLISQLGYCARFGLSRSNDMNTYVWVKNMTLPGVLPLEGGANQLVQTPEYINSENLVQIHK